MSTLDMKVNVLIHLIELFIPIQIVKKIHKVDQKINNQYLI